MKNENSREAILEQLDKLEEKTQGLLTLLEGFTHTQLNSTPTPNVWSPMQVLNHVLKSEMGSLAYVKKKLSFNPTLKKAGLISSIRSFFLQGFLMTPLKFNAPKGFNTADLPAESRLIDIAEKWSIHRRELKTFIQGIDHSRLDEVIYKHPAAGRLSIRQMMLFFIRHFDRHQKQILHRLPGLSLALYLLSIS